jgi:hypothetical protein
MVTVGEPTSYERSAAMVAPGQSIPARADHLGEMCAELMMLRALTSRLGTDLRSIASLGRRDPPGS